MYRTVEEKPVQKTDEKPIYKKLPGTVLFLIPTILVIMLFGVILGAIAGFKSTPEMLENGAVNVAPKDTGDRQITEEIIFTQRGCMFNVENRVIASDSYYAGMRGSGRDRANPAKPIC
jgi:hypothetical protein